MDFVLPGPFVNERGEVIKINAKNGIFFIPVLLKKNIYGVLIVGLLIN